MNMTQGFRRILKPLFSVSLIIVITLLSHAADPANPTWTIIFYGSGDNSLSPQLVEDIIKMEQVGSSDKFRIVVQADFDASNADENTESGLPKKLSKDTSRFLLTKSKSEDKLVTKPLERLPEYNHDDPQVLSDFLAWAMKKYPADRYGVIFWDHGGQWKGFGGDEQDGTEDSAEGITTSAIRECLVKAMRSRGLAKFDFIAFDTCLMGGIEVLEDFHDICDVFIACPEIDYGDGWNYAESLAWLKANPAGKMKDFAEIEVRSWEKLHLSENKDTDLILAAHCAYDMSKFNSVKSAFNSFAKVLCSELSPTQLEIPRQRRKTVEYSISAANSGSDSGEFIDLGHFAKHFSQDKNVSDELKKRSAILADAISAMVISKALGDEKNGALGLSIWYPVLKHDYDEDEDAAADDDDDDSDDDGGGDFEADATRSDFVKYKSLAVFSSSPWPDFLQRLWEAREAFDDIPVIGELSSPKISLANTQELKLELDVTSGKGAYMIHCSIVDNTKGRKNEFIYLGEVINEEINGPGKYKVAWDLKTISAMTENGEKILLGAVPKNSSGDFWISYASYRKAPHSKPMDVALLIMVKDNTAKILKMLDADGDNSAPAVITPRPGGTLSPVYMSERRKGNDPDKWKTGFFKSKKILTIPPEGLSALKLGMTPLDPGVYNLEFYVEDINGSTSNVIEYNISVKKQ